MGMKVIMREVPTREADADLSTVVPPSTHTSAQEGPPEERPLSPAHETSESACCPIITPVPNPNSNLVPISRHIHPQPLRPTRPLTIRPPEM